MKTDAPSTPTPKAPPAAPAPKPAAKGKAGSGPQKVPVRQKTPLRTRPSLPPIPLPKIIITQLEKLSGSVVQVSWAEGWLWVVAALGAILVVQGTLDWLLDLSWGIRLFFAIADVALLGWVVFRYFVQPVRNRLTPEQAALKAEIRWPGLRTSLISAVQLARNPEGSTRMVEVLIQQVSKRAAQMNFTEAVSSRHLKKISLIAVALALLAAGLGFAFMPKSFVLLRRILLSHEPLPTQTIVEAITTDFAIPAGETIEISARAKGTVPKGGRVEISYEGRPTQTVAVTLKPTTQDVFAVSLPNVQQPLTYRFYLNDGRGEEFKVKILYGPALEAISFEQNYPAYTGREKTQHSAGNLSLLAGSKLHIEARANQTLKSAFIQLKGVDQKIEMKIGADQKSISGEFSVPKTALEGFSIVMQNTDGIDSQANTLYRVEVIPDKTPEIVFAPGQPEESTLVEAGRPRLVFNVSDDFQVKQVFLCCEIPSEMADGAAPAPVSNVKKIPIPLGGTGGNFNVDFTWQNPAESGLWKQGNTISYWIEASDNNDVTGPGVGVSTKRQWRVISVEEKQKEIRDRLKANADTMDDISHQQDDLRVKTGEIIKKQ